MKNYVKTIRYDWLGKITCMAYADGYVMVRRPGRMPFAMALAAWERLSETPA